MDLAFILGYVLGLFMTALPPLLLILIFIWLIIFAIKKIMKLIKE